MGKFLDACYQPDLNQDEANSFKRPIKTKKIESVVKNLPTKQTNKQKRTEGQIYSAQNSFYKTFKE